MDFIKSFYQNLTQSGIPISLFLYCVLGYLFILISHSDNGTIPYLFGFFEMIPAKVTMIQDVSRIFGQTVITSGVATTLLRTNFFSNILQKQLFKVVYTEQMLKSRKDIDEIWDRVSKVLYSNKFPEIADKINQTITRRYFPINKHYYYYKCENSLKLKLIDKNSRLIEMTETISGVIKIHRNFLNQLNPLDKGSEIKLSGTIGLKDPNDKITSVKVLNGKFNGKELEPAFNEDYNKTVADKYKYEVCYNLRTIAGDTINYEYTLIKQLHVLDDIDFLNKICDNIHFDFTLYVNYDPTEFKVWFTDLGTADEYVNINKNKQNGNISKKYPGVMFPGQGYSLTLKIE